MDLLVTLGLVLLAYFIGSALERSHFKRILERENLYRQIPVVNFESLPDGWVVESSQLVSGSVVISVDYFKRIVAGLRGLIGGRVKTYEPLLDRARREAVLRMIEDARTQGFDAVVNVRIETSRLASSRGDGQGTAGVEMLAFGTGIRRAG